MKVSLNTVKQLTGMDLPGVDELVEKINHQLGGVDEVIDLASRYKDALVVKVVESEKHPNADRLSVCRVDVGAGELVQIVCGATNVKVGMWAVWLPPNSIVPSTYDDEEPFMLGARELRGVMSNGMLASARELAIGEDHDGIVEIDDNDLPQGKTITVGSYFAEVFELDDTIIDIENKMFTHRPDLFGQLGVAREIFAILQPNAPADSHSELRFDEPDWFGSIPSFENASDLELNVFNYDLDKIPRFMAVTMKNIEVGPSPLWLQTTLMRWGSKSINNVVDLTNYIMLLTAQPVHAYDYDKLSNQTIGARKAKDGEKVTLLNDKTYQLSKDDIVIADGNGPIGLAGIMGGGESEVTSDTKNVVLEVANFNMYTLRKSSMRHGLFTDALTRFNKGQSPLQADRVMSRLIDMMESLAGASQASDVHNLPSQPANFDKTSVRGEMIVSVEFINQRLGLELTPKQIGNILRLVNFEVHAPGENPDELSIAAPFWRTDIELAEDIVEEVGRLYGFEKLPRDLPVRSIKPVAEDLTRSISRQIRSNLRQLGANEVLTYSFVHENILTKTEQNPEDAFRLSNALSPDLQYYRLSVLPSLLDKVHANIKAGHDEFMLYEIGKGHSKNLDNDSRGLPAELELLDLVYTHKQPQKGAAYYKVQRTLSTLARDLNVELVYKPMTQAAQSFMATPFEFSRSAVVETSEGAHIGLIGELKQTVIKNFKLPSYTAAMSIDMRKLLEVINKSNTVNYQPLSKYPSTKQDISLQIPSSTQYGKVEYSVQAAIDELPGDYRVKYQPISIYQSDDEANQKTISFRMTISNLSRTLTDDDAKTVLNRISSEAAEDVDAKTI